MRHLTKLLLIVCIVTISNTASWAADVEINTILMRSTFKIAGQNSIGTAFIIGRPVPGDTQKHFYVLVTAVHVLRDIKEQHAILSLRKKQDDGFIKLAYPIQIRAGTRPLWKEH